MNLVWWELKKLLRRRMTKVLLAAGLVLAVVPPLSLGFANLGFGVEVTSPTWEARARSVQATRDAGAWHGPLTAEALAAAQADCRATLAAGEAAHAPETFVQGDMLYFAATVFTDAGLITWENWPARMTALDGDTLGSLYQQWDALTARRIEAAPAAWQGTLQAMKDRVTVPFTYDWVDGHIYEIAQLGDILFLLGLLVCAAVAPLFCAEVQTRVYTVSHCARHGRARLAAAKLGAAMLFACGAFLGLSGVFVGIQVLMFGARGLSASIQIAEYSCLLPVTLGQAEGLLVLGGLVSCLAAVALTAALSARFESTFPVLLCLFGALVFLRAVVLSGVLGPALAPLVQTLPFLTLFTELTGNVMMELPGERAMPVFLYRMAVQPVYLLVFLPLAWRWYVGRQVG